MTLSSFASVLGQILFIAAMLHVIATDLMHRQIRNWLVLALAAAYLPLALAAGLPGATIAMSCVAALVAFAVGFVAFAAGWIGGGDAKLAPVVILWLGAEQALWFAALTSLLGAALALAMLAIGALRRRQAGPAMPGGGASAAALAGASDRLALPYGPALAIAGLVLLRTSPWVEAL